jgi:PKD repeat protein
MKTVLFSTILICVFVSNSYSQNNEHWFCGTDEVNDAIYYSDKDVQGVRALLDAFVINYISQSEKDDEIYVIPIVFHVVHYYGAENISYSQILNAVEILNRDYAKLNADTVDIIDEFEVIAADCNIEFRLAKIDPDGNCTNGVTRTISEITYDGSATGGIHEIAPAWPRDKYLNIWICSSISDGIAGYAYYPSSVSAELSAFRDGVVIRHDYVGSNGTSNEQKSRILTHEIAHSFDLAHTWARSSFAVVGSSSNCTLDDGIEDTPNTVGSITCNLAAVSCGNLNNTQNYMEYTYCTRMFTQGQSAWMHAALNSAVSFRNNLWTNDNLIATGTDDSYVPQLCLPETDFFAENQLACQGATIQFNNLTYGTDQIDSYTWDFEGGDPESSNDENPEIIYSTDGVYYAQLDSYNATGSTQMHKEEYIHIYNPNTCFALPYNESFETTNYPISESESYNDYFTVDKGIGVWEHVEGQGTDGAYCVRVQNRYNDIGLKNLIMLPNITITDENSALMVTYKAAYGRTETATSDRLRFYVSNDCGVTKTLVSVASSTALTSVYVDDVTNYVPAAEDWKTHSFTISSSRLNGPNLRLIIETESGGGNAIYIDEISFSQTSSLNDLFSLSNIDLYPNPFYDELFLSNPFGNEELFIQIVNSNGDILADFSSTMEIINLKNYTYNLSTGIYFVHIRDEKALHTIKLVKI